MEEALVSLTGTTATFVRNGQSDMLTTLLHQPKSRPDHLRTRYAGADFVEEVRVKVMGALS